MFFVIKNNKTHTKQWCRYVFMAVHKHQQQKSKQHQATTTTTR